MASWTWRTVEGTIFDLEDASSHGMMPLEDAKRLVEESKSELLGFSFSTEQPGYVWIVRVGTISGLAEGWVSMVYSVRSLPNENLFDDGWSGNDEVLGEFKESTGGWARPGRGQGIGTSFATLSFMQSVDPEDMHQGSVGNCWLISALASAAEYKTLLPSVVKPRGLPEDGKYTLRLYDYGRKEFVDVEVDDSIPIHPNANMPAFANLSKSGETWPTVFEKAFAKMAGSYPKLHGGYCTFAFGVLTGCTDLEVIIKVSDSAWQLAMNDYVSADPHDEQNTKLKLGTWPDETSGGNPKSLRCIIPMLEYYENNNYMMCAGSVMGSDTDQTADGIARGHAYSILQVRRNIADTGITLIQIRNPWATEFFTGAWNDDSTMWKKHPKVRKALNFQPSDDGLFWITPEDFEKNFSTIFVCKKDVGPNRQKMRKNALSDVMKQCAEAGVALPFHYYEYSTDSPIGVILNCLVRCRRFLDYFVPTNSQAKKCAACEV